MALPCKLFPVCKQSFSKKLYMIYSELNIVLHVHNSSFLISQLVLAEWPCSRTLNFHFYFSSRRWWLGPVMLNNLNALIKLLKITLSHQTHLREKTNSTNWKQFILTEISIYNKAYIFVFKEELFISSCALPRNLKRKRQRNTFHNHINGSHIKKINLRNCQQFGILKRIWNYRSNALCWIME